MTPISSLSTTTIYRPDAAQSAPPQPNALDAPRAAPSIARSDGPPSEAARAIGRGDETQRGRVTASAIAPEAERRERKEETRETARAEEAEKAARKDEAQRSDGAAADQRSSVDDAARIAELRQQDAATRANEQAQVTVGGRYAGAPSFRYEIGPDGERYAVGGEVTFDATPIKGDLEGTIEKMETVKAAALASSEPSGAEASAAIAADQIKAAARAELRAQQAEMSMLAYQKAREASQPPAGLAAG